MQKEKIFKHDFLVRESMSLAKQIRASQHNMQASEAGMPSDSGCGRHTGRNGRYLRSPGSLG